MLRALRQIIPAMLLAGAVAAPVPALAQPDLEGTYLARSVDPDGNEYGSVVHISHYRESFLIARFIPDRSDDWLEPTLASIGIGILNGGMLAVSEYSPDTSRIALFRIEEGGSRLVGRWTFVDGDGVVHDETLTKVPGTLYPSEDDLERPAPPRR